LPRLRIRIRTSSGELEIEGNDFAELKQGVLEVGISEQQLEKLIKEAAAKFGQERDERPSDVEESQVEAGLPERLLAKVGNLTNREFVAALLLHEKPVMTKKEMISRSIEIGRALSPQWMDKHFAEETKGLLVPTKNKEGMNAYRLSDQGRIKTRSVLSDLTKSE
jgi:hypothetical protein